MKKFVKIITLLLIISFTFSCEKFLDINHSPNRTEVATVNLVFPSAVTSVCYVTGGTWFLLGSVWSQHWTSGPNAPQYQSVDNFSITPSDYDSRNWGELYAGALMDFEWVRKNSEENKNWTYYLMATTMQCYTYQILVDFYDKIPFTEALQVTAPHFDDGQLVYDSLIARLDYALSKDLTESTCQIPGEDDLIYQGNMNNWIKFANTLKLKIFMRQVYVRTTIAEEGIKKLYTEGAQFLSTTASMTEFVNIEDHQNPIYATEWFNFGNQNMVASRTLLEYLGTKGISDPRIANLFTSSSGVYFGMYQGDFRNEVSKAAQNQNFSTPIITATTPVFLMTESESLFLQAEACLRTWGTGDTKTLFDAAVKADYLYYGITTDPVPTYNENAPFEMKLENIIVQKWVAAANKTPIESFFEHNRTGYPMELNLKASEDAYIDGNYDGKGYFIVSQTSVLSPPVLYPKRLLFPSSEKNNNPYYPTVEPVNEPVWWDVQ